MQEAYDGSFPAGLWLLPLPNVAGRQRLGRGLWRKGHEGDRLQTYPTLTQRRSSDRHLARSAMALSTSFLAKTSAANTPAPLQHNCSARPTRPLSSDQRRATPWQSPQFPLPWIKVLSFLTLGFRVMSITLLSRAAVVFAVALAACPAAAQPIRLLIVDGQNNHDWPRATRILKGILESSGQFTVGVSTSPRRQPQNGLGQVATRVCPVWRCPEQLQRRCLANGSREGPGRLCKQRRRAGHLPCRQQFLSELARLQRDDRLGLAGQELWTKPGCQSPTNQFWKSPRVKAAIPATGRSTTSRSPF